MNLYALSSLLAAFFCYGLSLFVLLKTGRNPERRAFAAVTFLIGIWTLFPFLTVQVPDPTAALNKTRLVYVAALFVPSLFFHFMLHTMRIAHEPRERAILRGSYFVASFFLIFINSPLFIRGTIAQAPYSAVRPGPLYLLFVLYFAYMYLHASARLLRLYHQSSGHFREHLKYIGLAFVLAFLAGIIHFSAAFGIPEVIPHDFFVISYSTIIAYAIVRYRLMDIKLAITRTTVFMTVYALALGLPLLAALSLQPQLERSLGSRWWVWLWVACALLATVAHYVNFYFQRFAENRLLAEQRRYQATLRQASEGMTRIRQLPRLLKLTAGIVSRAVGLTHVSIYLQDGETKRYVQQVAKGKDGPSVGTGLELDDPLIKYLLVHKNAIVLEEFHIQRQQAEDPGLREVEMSLRRLGAALVIPSFVHDQLLGFVVMGAKRSGRIYTDDDIKVLITLANQAALAIENARFYEAEKERQAEMFHTAQLASLGTMAGSMGHQINNRFNTESILAGTMREALRDADLTGLSEPIKELIGKAEVNFDKIEKDAIRGGDIVKTLLNFSKPGKMEHADFPGVLEMSKDLAQYRVKFEEIDYEPVLANPLPTLNANKNQLAEVFFNLLSNAYDAIKSKEQAIQEGKLNVAGRAYKGKLAITVTATHRNGAEWLQAVVHDNGVGIKQEDLSRLFVPFFTTKATSQKGTGLGLYVIKRIVENHGGKVEVNSIYGEGTTFTILLPAFAEKG